MPKTQTISIGIDVGKSGGVCVLSRRGIHLLRPFVGITGGKSLTKTAKENICLLNNLSQLGEALDKAESLKGGICVTMEHIYASPKASAASMVTFGRHAGSVMGYLIARHHAPAIVRAAEWKGSFGLLGKDKQASLDEVKARYPEANLHRTSASKTDSDGLAEAVLIALYGLEQQAAANI
jgi:hypothetical protein